MKRFWFILATLLLTLSLLFTSCAGEETPSAETESGQGGESESNSEAEDSVSSDEAESESDSEAKEEEEEEEEPSEDPVTVTERYLPATVFAKMRNIFEGKLATFNTYSTGNAPYAISDVYTISDCRLTSISIPVAKTLGADEDGNFFFTLSVFDNSYTGLKQSPKRVYRLRINGEQYGLSENTSNIYRFIDVDLRSYSIVLSENETVAFFSVSDTLYPAYLPSDSTQTNPAHNLMKQEFSQATGFFQKMGTTALTTSINSLLYDLEWERTYTREELLAMAAEERRNEAVIEALREKYEGKYFSILGDSISTYKGVSNNTHYNSTIGSNAVWYPNNNSNFYDFSYTYWGRLVNDLGMRLCVNNSWSGSRVYYASSTTNPNMLQRAVELDNDNGTPNDPTDDIAPDVILVYLGINDLHNGTPLGGLYDLLSPNEDPNVTVGEWLQGKTATDFCTTYALSLKAMREKYPNAEIYCMTLIQSNHANVNAQKIEKYNACISALARYFGATLIDQEQIGYITHDICHAYGSDSTALHPNPHGHLLMERTVALTMYEKYFGKYTES